jgi:hypothetical protein
MQKFRDDLRFEEVYKALMYDCFTGEFRWSENAEDLSHMPAVSIERFRGRIAGTINNGYLQICLKQKVYRAHRLAWLMTYEKWPDGEIDHIDGNRANNRILNLRDVTPSENCRNMRLSPRSTTGFVGVSVIKKTGKYRASIKLNGKMFNLGHYDTIDEAIEARKSQSEIHGFHPLHGTVKEVSNAQSRTN